MPLIADRVQETTSTIGTGTVTLAGAVSGYQTFASAFPSGGTVPYVLVSGTTWECGTGTYTVSGTTLTRSPTSSSNSGSAITLAGTSTVFCDLIAALAGVLPGVATFAAIVPAGSTQGGATAVTSPYTQANSTTNGQGIVLPTPVAPMYFVDNNSAYTLLIYPQSGGSIDGGAANAPITLQPNSYWMGGAESSTTWASFDGNIFSTNGQITVTNTVGGINLSLKTRVFSETSSSTPTPNCDAYDLHIESALSAAPTIAAPASVTGATCSFATSVMTCTVAPSVGTFQVGQLVNAAGVAAGTTIASLGTGAGGTGTYNLSTSPGTIAAEATSACTLPYEGQPLFIFLTDNGTARALSWNAIYAATTVALPTTTVISTRLRCSFLWNAVSSKWDCIGVA